MHLDRRVTNVAPLVAAMVITALTAIIAQRAMAAVSSIGDVKPPLALVDTPGSTKTFTVPVPSSTNGGVYVGDQLPGRLDINNGWTLNSTFGIVANTPTSSISQLFISDASRWNTTGDFDIGRQATGIATLVGGSTLAVGGHTRLGTSAGAVGQLLLSDTSALNTAGLVVGAAGNGTLDVGEATVNPGFVEVGRETTGDGTIVLNAATLNSAGGINVGIRGSGLLNAFIGATINSSFANFGVDLNVPNGYSTVATSIGNGIISGPGSIWNNNQGISVAYNTRGSLTLLNGAELTTGFLEVSRYGRGGTLTVNNSPITIAKNPNFSGTPALIIGTETNSEGSATIFGADSAVTIDDNGFVEIGRRSANANFSVLSGADVVVRDTIIATEAGSVGMLELSDIGTTWNGGGVLEIGRSGRGTLNVTNGAFVNSDVGRIALTATSVQTSANLSGLDSRWYIGDALTVGELGSGALVVGDGAEVNVGSFLRVGTNAGGVGLLDISGSAPDPNSPGATIPSAVTSTAQIIVGDGGNGAANLRDGARLASHKAGSASDSSAIIGHLLGAAGSIAVEGSNSLWTGDGAVNVGFRGAGSLNVQLGARVESVDGVLARLPGSTGEATLLGSGSAWLVENALYVGGRPATSVAGPEGMAGPGGMATLTSQNGSYVSVGNRIETFSDGTIDVSIGGSVTVGNGSPQGAAGAVQVYPAGELSGSGTIIGNVINGGVVAPGNSAGIFTVEGNYTQSSGGVLAIEIGGTSKGADYDSLHVAGDAALAGTLNVSLVDGFSPATGSTFEILTSGFATTGTFTNQILPTLPAGFSWDIAYGANSVLLQVSGTALPGDFTQNGVIDAADYVAWRNSGGPLTGYNTWRTNFGRRGATGASLASSNTGEPLVSTAGIPEPASFLVVVSGLVVGAFFRERSLRSTWAK